MKTIATMTLVTFAVEMAMLAAPAVHAQEGYFNSEIGNGRWSAVEPTISPADTQHAYFNAEIGNLPSPETGSALASSPRKHTVKTGKLKLAAAVMLGDVVLPAGDYNFRQVESGEQQFVEFSQTVEDDYVPEAQSVYVRQVIASVNSTRRALNATVARTELDPTLAAAMASRAKK